MCEYGTVSGDGDVNDARRLKDCGWGLRLRHLQDELKMPQGEELEYIAAREDDAGERDDEAWVVDRGHATVHAADQ